MHLEWQTAEHLCTNLGGGVYFVAGTLESLPTPYMEIKKMTNDIEARQETELHCLFN